MSRCRRTAFLLATLALAGCGDAPLPCPHPDDGLPVVENRGPGAWEHEGFEPELTLLWSRGGTREGEELAYPADAAASADGRVAVVDFQLAELVVIERDGTWGEPWARRGPGPGELSAPGAVAWAAPDTVVVFDLGVSALVYAGEDGARVEGVPPAFVAAVIARGEVRWVAVDRSGTAFLEATGAVENREDARRHSVLRQPLGGRMDTVVDLVVPVVPAGTRLRVPRPGFPTPTVAVGAGRTYVADPGGGYGITVRDGEGRMVRHVCRSAPPLPLTDVERGGGAVPQERRELAEAIAAGPHAGEGGESAPAAIGRLVAGTNGRLWVQRERPSPWDTDASFYGEDGALHDVFDADGLFLGSVRLPDGFRLQAARGDTVWGFRRGDLGEIWVEAYRL